MRCLSVVRPIEASTHGKIWEEGGMKKARMKRVSSGNCLALTMYNRLDPGYIGGIHPTKLLDFPAPRYPNI